MFRSGYFMKQTGPSRPVCFFSGMFHAGNDFPENYGGLTQTIACQTTIHWMNYVQMALFGSQKHQTWKKTN
jgi:hypothetical protein